MVVDGICVIVENGPMSQEEIACYIERLQRKYKKLRLNQLMLRRENGYVNLRCSFAGNPLQRILRLDCSPGGHGCKGAPEREEDAI